MTLPRQPLSNEHRQIVDNAHAKLELAAHYAERSMTAIEAFTKTLPAELTLWNPPASFGGLVLNCVNMHNQMREFVAWAEAQQRVWDDSKRAQDQRTAEKEQG